MARSHTSGGTDAVRRSLDSHAVDAESEDKPYLISMLRRLGYSDAQIQDYLAGRTEPGAPALPAAEAPAAQSDETVQSAPAAEPAHAHVEADHGEQRDVEVEYTGPGLQDYRLVDPVDFFGDDSNLVEFEAQPAAAPAVEEAWETGDAGSETYTPGEAEVGSDGQPLAEFTPAEPDAAQWEPEPALEPAKDDAAEQAELAELARRQGLDWEALQPQDQVIHYGDYTLYQKDDLRDGQPARVYAFSKTPPGEGYEAAKELPDGYHVAENPETGRPFLRRTGEEDWGLAEAGGAAAGPQGAGDPGRRRVRLKRVRAANREEAMRLVEREGGSPLASVPIDIEKHLGDE